MTVKIIINYIKSQETSFWENYNSENFQKAVNQKRFLNCLQPMKGFKRGSSFLNSKNDAENELIKKFNDTIINDSMNPHKPYTPEEYYCRENSEGIEFTHCKSINELFKYKKDENGNKTLNLIRVGKNNQLIIQLGEKGSGKTISQNIVLHKNHDLLEDNKILWIRCDAAKLYKIWNKNPKKFNKEINYNEFSSSRITIENYLYGQLAYVFAKHLKGCKFESKLIIEIYNDLKSSSENKDKIQRDKSKRDQKEEDVRFPLSYKQMQNDEINSLTDIIDHFSKTINIDEGNLTNPNKNNPNSRSYLLDKIFTPVQESSKESNMRAFTLWINTVQAIKEFILGNKKEYYLMSILDGIDNVNLVEKSSLLPYICMKQNLRNLLCENTKHPNEIRRASFRERTLSEMSVLLNMYNDSHINTIEEASRIIRQEQIGELDFVIQKRTNYVIDSIKNLDNKDYYSQCITKEIIKQIHCYFPFYKNSQIWHNNIRSKFRTYASLMRTIAFRYYFLNKPKEFDIKQQLKTYGKINILLNGRFYVDSDANYHNNEGDAFFNLYGRTKHLENRKNKPLYFIYIYKNTIIPKKS